MFHFGKTETAEIPLEADAIQATKTATELRKIWKKIRNDPLQTKPTDKT